MRMHAVGPRRVVLEHDLDRLADFRAQYLSKTPVDTVKVSGVSPGPEQPLNRQLTSTAPQLLDEMIKLVKELL